MKIYNLAITEDMMMNNSQAMEWFEVYRKASAASEDGVVTDQDALACLQRALDSQDPEVYYALAEYYFDNANGDSGMIAKAQDLLRKSAEEGCPNAECLLAEKLLNMGGDDNLAEARKWMARAEEHGEDVDELAPRLGVKSSRILELERLSETDDDATAELAVAYMRGEGCVRDLEHAYELASRIAYEASFARFFNSVNSDDPDEAAIVKRIGDEIADFERAHPEFNDSTDPDEDNRRKPSDDWMFPNGHDDGESVE